MSLKNCQVKKNSKSKKSQPYLTSPNQLGIDNNFRSKRIEPVNLFIENNLKNNIIFHTAQQTAFKGKKIQTKNEEEKNYNIFSNTTKQKINRYEIFKELNENNKILFRRKFEEINNMLVKEFQNNECQEFYLLIRNWFSKLKDFLKSLNIQIFKELKGQINNNKLLIDKQIFEKALLLNEDKKIIKIINPKFAFYYKIKPVIITKKLWEFCQNIFGGGPEIKMFAEKIEFEPGKFGYKRDLLKYFKINCIILPPKIRNEINDFKNDIIKDIKIFYTYFNKYKKIGDLLSYLNQIIKNNNLNNLNLIDTNNYKCWIDLNYDDFNKLQKKINRKINDIYNMNNNNYLSPLNLEQLEKEDEKEYINSNENKDNSHNKKFGFKLFPLNVFKDEILMNICPNQFTNNFDKLNENQIINFNHQCKYFLNDNCEIRDEYIINQYPELNIIIEQIVGSFFYKNPKIKYKICACDYGGCRNKGIMTKSCDCGQKYYCSEKCKNNHKKYHEEECSNLLLKYFIDVNENKNINLNNNNKIYGEYFLGIKGIKNIGNTCYMNTALQCLSNCVELRNYFLFGNPHKDINKNNILGFKGLVAYGFEYIIKKLWLDKDKVLDITKFKKAMGICNNRFKEFNQQDTHEFINFLIDSLHEDLNRVNNKIYIKKEERNLNDEIKSKIEWNNFLRRNQSILIDLFYGLFKSTVTCQECKNTSVDFNTFSSLSLNIKNSNKIENINNYNSELNIKMDKLNINSNKNNENIIIIEQNKIEKKCENNNENKCENIIVIDKSENENEINKKKSKAVINNENIIQNFKIKTENISLGKNKKMIDINENSAKKEKILFEGKENKIENEIELEEQKQNNNLPIKIRIIFFLYSSEEKPLQFFLPIKDINEFKYKLLLLKISKLFNKDPYSLYLYHVDEDKNIIKVYGENNFNLFDNKKNSILFVSEINKDVIKNNLSKVTNEIFYNSFTMHFSKKKFITREDIEGFLNQNKENVIKYIKNIVNEEKDCECIENNIVNSHYMNLEKIYQITLKNYIYDQNKQNPKYYYYPKIVVFSKLINIINLYYEVFKMKKNIIIEDDPNNNNNKKQIDKNTVINEYFKELFVTKDNFNINKIFENKTPFYLCIQKYNNNKSVGENNNEEIYLLLNEMEKNRKLIEILDNLLEQNNFPNEQIILKIYWNPKYNDNIKKYLRPEKIDSFLNKLMSFDENINSNVIDNKNDKKQKEDETKKDNNKPLNIIILDSHKKNKNTKYVTSNGKINNLNKYKDNNKEEKFIQINPEISLNDIFEILGEEEILDESNLWFCENCKKNQKAIKKIEIYNAPKILIIQIKRFNHSNKINTKVNFPLTDLDIRNYILSKDKNDHIKYDLFAVANHYGSLYYGHYTAICKNSLKNKWYEYNDSCVTKINDESTIISHNAYVLFYRQQGLSQLNWGNIYNKKFINIDINNQNSLIDYNYDFIYNIKDKYKNDENSQNNKNNDEDINGFDKILINLFLKKNHENNKLINNKNNEKNKNNNYENFINIMGSNNYDGKDSNNFLSKKRSNLDI